MMYLFSITLLLSSGIFNFVDACLATSPVQVPSTTSEPITVDPLRRCAQASLTLEQGDNLQPQHDIDVTSSNYVSTRVGTTLETISTMQVSCSAIAGYNAFMTMDEGFTPLENVATPLPRTVTVTVSCNSADMVWNYVTTYQGQTYTRAITVVMCNQSL